MKINTILMIIMFTTIMLFPDLIIARDLGSAANSAVATAKTIARILSIFGLLAGGILLQIPGLSNFGKTTLGAAIIGSLCTFGGPTLVRFFESIFGNL